MDNLNLRDTAVIIFVRHPELGRVKTRLAKTIGDEKALRVYEQLLQHTLDITLPLAAAKFVFYADEIQKHDIWKTFGFWKCKQKGGDLGERMQHAFSSIFKLGFKKVAIIGSDCFQLTSDLMLDAFNALTISDIVLGPAVDGGYYLLGMKTVHQEFFKNKIWSTDTVALQTIEDAKRLNLKLELLKTLYDVDGFEDLAKSGLTVE